MAKNRALSAQKVEDKKGDSSKKILSALLQKRKGFSEDLASKEDETPSAKRAKTNAGEEKTPEAATELSNTQEAIEVHGDAPTVFQGVEYAMLRRTHPITPTSKVSCRGKKRENLLLNMESKILNEDFEGFYTSCIKEEESTSDSQEKTQPLYDFPLSQSELKTPAPPSIRAYDFKVLKRLATHVAKAMTTATLEEFKAMMAAEHQKLPEKEGELNALVEWFLKMKKGVCRQHSLYAACLLVKLIAKLAALNSQSYEESNSRVYRYRGKLKPIDETQNKSSHSVLIYETENGHRYLIDPSFRASVFDLRDLSDESRAAIAKLYLPYKGLDFIEKINATYDALVQPRALSRRSLSRS